MAPDLLCEPVRSTSNSLMILALDDAGQYVAIGPVPSEAVADRVRLTVDAYG